MNEKSQNNNQKVSDNDHSQMNHNHEGHDQMNHNQSEHQVNEHENQGNQDRSNFHNLDHEGQADHHDHHAMMVDDFKRRFFFALAITLPILLISPMIQMFLGVDNTFCLWRETIYYGS